MAGGPARKKLFRIPPPKEFVEQILIACGLSAGISDLRWFTAKELNLASQEEWLPELEAYYIPCKAKRFFHGRGSLDGTRMISILRHMLEPLEYCIQVQERTYQDAKQSLYQIQPMNAIKDLSGSSLEVTFD